MGPLKCEDPNSGQSPEAMQGKDGVDRMPGMDVLGPDLRGMTAAVSPLVSSLCLPCRGRSWGQAPESATVVGSWAPPGLEWPGCHPGLTFPIHPIGNNISSDCLGRSLPPPRHALVFTL